MPKYNDRLSAAKRGYGYKWQKEREKFLVENPFCADHEKLGRNVLATIVDHIVPHKLGEAKEGGDQSLIKKALKLFWDRKNWQSLCKHCHDAHKQRQEKGSMTVGCDTSGIPIANNHHWNSQGAG